MQSIGPSPELTATRDYPLAFYLSLAICAAAVTMAAGVRLTAILADKTRPVVALETSERWDRALAFSPRGMGLVAADRAGVVKLWDGTNGRLRKTICNSAGPIDGLAFSPDGRSMVGCGLNGAIQCWETAGWHRIWRRQYTSRAIRTCVFSPAGRLLAAGGDDTGGNGWPAGAHAGPGRWPCLRRSVYITSGGSVCRRGRSGSNLGLAIRRRTSVA
jgi:WD40 repeat protein